MTELLPGRRELLFAPLLATLPMAFVAEHAEADKLNPEWTIVRPPDQIKWQSSSSFPPNSVEQAPLFGATTDAGLYYVLVKWHPGYMSAPHTYVTDRLCVVVSGTWWVNSGADFEPENRSRRRPAPSSGGSPEPRTTTGSRRTAASRR